MLQCYPGVVASTYRSLKFKKFSKIRQSEKQEYINKKSLTILGQAFV
jgi:hypothetical protein